MVCPFHRSSVQDSGGDPQRCPVGERRAAGGPCRAWSGQVECFRQPEVQHLDRAVVLHLHVGGLEIAVDDASLVGGFQRLGDLFGDRQCFVEGNLPLLDAICQRWAFDEFEHQRSHAVSFFEAVDGSDVRMVQGGENLRFTLEPYEAVWVRREGIRQRLERHIAVKFGVVGAVDLAHAALADLGGDFEPPRVFRRARYLTPATMARVSCA